MAKKLITLTVDRSRWLNGHVIAATDQTKPDDQSLRSRLHDGKSGLQCCLGFGVRRAGLTVQEIGCCGVPSDLLHSGATKNEDLMIRLVVVEDAATEINDANPSYTTAKRRETALREAFKEVGIRLCFTGDSAVAVRKARRIYGKVVA